METLSELVRNLAIILMLASLLEMFLPARDMSRYVQTIVGLFVLVTILNPLLNLLNEDWGANLEAWTGQNQGPPLEEILEQGARLGEADRDKAASQYREKLAAQVKGVAGLVPGVKVQEAAVKVREQEGVVGGLEGIQLTVALEQSPERSKSSSTTMTTITPIRGKGIEESRGGLGTSPSERIDNLRTTLANLYGLQPEAVEVKEIKEGNTGGR
ncbi:MAG TPA: stage III sporulation protein AF [Bacillota bacterium]|nr:stage III sporulation protein AF [Bacillota bacterium]